MNIQETFDKVVTHLLTQMSKSMTRNEHHADEFCAYRGDKGMMCAAGPLIPDEKYQPEFEGIGISQHLFDSADKRDQDLLLAAGITTREEAAFVGELQSIHDCYEPHDWRRELQEVALERKLVWTFGE